MFDPTQRTVDHDVETFVKMFERAQVGEVAPVSPRKPQNVLLVLDASTQDDLSIRVARHLQKWFECSLSVLDAREQVDTNELADDVATSLSATALPKASGDSFEQILDGIESSGGDLIIVPCPYGRDYEAVGPDSSGTVIDVLLARSPVPLLVVRKPYGDEDELFHQVMLVLIGENKAAPAAAAWAAGFVGHSGSVQLVLILEEEFYNNVRSLMQEIAPDVEISADSLSSALLKTHMHLHVGLQKAAEQSGFHYELAVLRGDEPAADSIDDRPKHPLLVLALERADHASQGHVHDHIRSSPNLLLIVSVD